jgi:hypothetical protein
MSVQLYGHFWVDILTISTFGSYTVHNRNFKVPCVLHALAWAKNTLWASPCLSLFSQHWDGGPTVGIKCCATMGPRSHFGALMTSDNINARTTEDHCWKTLLRNTVQQQPTWCGVKNTSTMAMFSKDYILPTLFEFLTGKDKVAYTISRSYNLRLGESITKSEQLSLYTLKNKRINISAKLILPLILCISYKFISIFYCRYW